MYNLKLQWRNFNINMNRVQDWIKSNIESEISGISSGEDVTIHFLNEPSQEEIEEIQDYWNGLKKSSSEAKTYKSQEDYILERKNAKQNAKQSALNKLKEVAGLDEDEVNALLEG